MAKFPRIAPQKNKLNCVYRGEIVDTKPCQVCSNRGKQINVYKCEIHGQCTMEAYQAGQEIKNCKKCDDMKSE